MKSTRGLLSNIKHCGNMETTHSIYLTNKERKISDNTLIYKQNLSHYLILLALLLHCDYIVAFTFKLARDIHVRKPTIFAIFSRVPRHIDIAAYRVFLLPVWE